MTGFGPPDKTPRARGSQIVFGRVVAPVLIDRKDPGINPSFAFVVLVEISVDVDGRRLNEGLVGVGAPGMVDANDPRLVLAEGDAGGALRGHRMCGPVGSGLGRALPGVNDGRAVGADRKYNPEIIENIWLIIVQRPVRIDPFEIDDVLAFGVAADEMILPLHVGESPVDPDISGAKGRQKHGGIEEGLGDLP